MVFKLKLVEEAIKKSNNKNELNELTSLRDSLFELIALTSENCIPEKSSQNPLDEEYALFKVI